MAGKSHKERMAHVEKFREELIGFVHRFEEAFDELHDAVVRAVKTPGQFVGPHHDYPTMSILDSGFPSMQEAGFYRNTSPRDYVGTLRPQGLAGLLIGYQRPPDSFPKGAALATYLRDHDIGRRLGLQQVTSGGGTSDWAIDRLVAHAVERYLHLYGLDTSIDDRRRMGVIAPLVQGTVWRKLELRLVVPIALTHFDVDRYRLSDTAYITRIPPKLQLARTRIRTMGTGAVEPVVAAATHAFVSEGWTIEGHDVEHIRRSLGETSANVTDAIDNLFGALRVATGVVAGYAQVLWVPKRWALDYFCDLTPVYGTTLRQYPAHYDNYGWTRQGPTVTRDQLVDVKRVYGSLVSNKTEGVRLALRRLNGCLTRTDAADAILDGTIGLELLLGDDQNQSLSYKLRLRAAALALLAPDQSRPAASVAAKVKRLYSARSTIVHGLKRKETKRAAGPVDTRHDDDRALAAELLRFVLDVLLTHPEYQDPAKIDDGLLLRADALPVSAAEPLQRKRGRTTRAKSRKQGA